MKATGVFATAEEIAFLKEKAHVARTTPAFGLSSEQVLSGRDFASLAHLDASRACHALALKHGLPEISGYYGIDLSGEFVEY